MKNKLLHIHTGTLHSNAYFAQRACRSTRAREQKATRTRARDQRACKRHGRAHAYIATPYNARPLRRGKHFKDITTAEAL